MEATETVNVETPGETDEMERVAGFNVASRPAREPIAVRSTLPVKPFTPVTVMLEVAEKPAWMEREDGLLTIVKSVTMSVTCVERVIVALVPLAVPTTLMV